MAHQINDGSAILSAKWFTEISSKLTQPLNLPRGLVCFRSYSNFNRKQWCPGVGVGLLRAPKMRKLFILRTRKRRRTSESV